MKKIFNALVSRSLLVLSITAFWVGLWGEISFANVAGGLVLAIGILALGLSSPTSNSIRVKPLVKLTWLVLVDLVTSTVSVAYEAIRLSDKTDESIIAVDLPLGSQRHLFLLTTLITVTPGTAVVDADATKGVLYLHLLHHEKAEATVNHVVTLAELSCLGLPSIDHLPTTQPTGTST